MTIDTEDGGNRHHPSRHSVGALLREARQSLGLDLPDAARGLRIRLVYLQGIETDDYARLPGKTYVLGFLRSYAEYLGLDGDDVVARYRRQLDDRDLPTPKLHFPLREPEARLPRGAVLLLSLVLAAGAVYGGARWLNDESLQTVDRVAPVPERLIGETRPAPSFPARNDPSSAFAAVTPQPTESGSSASVLSQPTPMEPAPQVAAAPPPPVASEPSNAGVAPAIEPPPGSPLAAAAADAAARVAAVPPPKPARPEPNRAETARPEPPKPTPQQQTQTLNQAQAVQPVPPQTQLAALPPAPAPKPRDIVVVARVDSWIEVRDGNNQPLASLLLRVGDSYRVPEGANYRLVTGDVRGLEVRVDGVAVRQRGADDNKPHRVLSLDADRLHSGNAVAD
ncbi:MAG: helix-turn-helix domain-containing protein [Reyranellaceae bacterium]